MKVQPDFQLYFLPSISIMNIQSILFSRDKFSRTQTIEWLKSHNKKHLLDVKLKHYRARQVEPSRFISSTFRTITISPGVQMIIGKLK